jgi:hypothetical protein
VSLSSAATLLVAELDLKLVQSILSAIRTADIESAAEKKPPLPGTERPAYLPRGCDQAELRCDSRVDHSNQMVPQNVIYTARPCRPVQAMPVVIETVIVEKKSNDDLCSPLRAPWEQPVWNTPTTPPAKIKINRYQPDIHHIGTMIDYFI